MVSTWGLPQDCRQTGLGVGGGWLGGLGLLGFYLALPGGCRSPWPLQAPREGRSLAANRGEPGRPGLHGRAGAMCLAGLLVSWKGGAPDSFLHGSSTTPIFGVPHPSGVPRTPVLGPLHSRGWISHRIARQSDIFHPGGCHGASKRDDLCWGCREESMRATPPLPSTLYWPAFPGALQIYNSSPPSPT